MFDFRNANFDDLNPEDPFRNDSKLDPNVKASDAGWGWIAAAVFLVIVLAIAFGAGHRPGQTGTNMASNTTAPVNTMAPPAGRMAPTTVLPPSATPAPTATTTPPIAAAPNTPAQRNNAQ